MADTRSSLSLAFRDGMLWLDGTAPEAVREKFFKQHTSSRWIAPAFRYADILEEIGRHGTPLRDDAGKFFSSGPLVQHESLDPFDFQREAIEAWEQGGRKGLIVLPTGAGKSFMTRILIARLAIEETGCSTLIIVPTKALLYQWYSQLRTAFSQEIGILGDDLYSLRPITVTTYASARLHMSMIGNRWRMVVFDEVHRKIAAGSSSNAARFCCAPYRLGITATPAREGLPLLEEVIGPVVYRKTTEELVERQILSVFRTVRIRLSPEQREIDRYFELKRPMDLLWQNAKEKHIIRDSTWMARQRLSNPDQAALAQHALLKAYRFWQSLPSRFSRLEEILMQHQRDRILIFTESRESAYEISRRFLIPAVTADIDSDERTVYLQAFARGECRALVTAKVLEEGIDLPDANVAVMLAGRRKRTIESISYIQRRGRILRRREGKEAIVYEIAHALPQRYRRRGSS